MNHERLHCTGEGCARKGDCLLYQLHEVKKADGVVYAAYVDADECQRGGYHFFKKREA